MTPPRRVALVGQSWWTRRIGQLLKSQPGSELTVAAVPMADVRSGLSVGAWRTLAKADVIVRIGFRPGAETIRGLAFDGMWRVLMSVNTRAVTIVWWIGTDVVQAVEQAQRSGPNRRFRDAVRRSIHFAGSSRLVEELASIGVHSRPVAVPGTKDPPRDVPPLPARFAVLTYIPDARPEFYGGPTIVRAAMALPSIPFFVIGGDGAWLDPRPSNLQFFGWQQDPGDWYQRATVVIRLVEHDSVGGTVVEGLFFARHVMYSYPSPYTVYVPYADAKKLTSEVAALAAKQREGVLLPNVAGREYALQHYNPRGQLLALHHALVEASECKLR